MSLSLVLPARAEVTITPTPATHPALAPLYQELAAAVATVPTEGADSVRVTIGAAALRNALARDSDGPLIAAFVTSTEFAEALGARERTDRITAVYSNPDPLDQLALVRGILGNPAVGVVDAPASHALSRRLVESQLASVVTIPVGAGQGANALLRAAGDVDAVIVLPDTGVLNQSNIHHVVRSLYQQRKVLIGYSDALTRVGSLASVFPRRDAIINRIARVLSDYAQTGVMPVPRFVRDVDITVNERLARSLNIVVPDRDELLDAVRRRSPEGRP